MKLRFVLLLVVSAMVAGAARAQFGLYVNPIGIRISNSTADTGTFAFLGQNSTSKLFWGANLGTFYDFQSSSKIRAGVDVRDSILHGGGAALNNFLVGVRFSPSPGTSRLRPYIEPVLGAGTSRAPFTAIRVTKFEGGVFAGLDYVAGRHVNLRAVEVGYANLSTVSSQTIGSATTVPSATLLSFSSGIVFRFP